MNRSISIYNRTMIVDGHKFKFPANANRSFDLLKAFLRSPTLSLSAYEILEKVYEMPIAWQDNMPSEQIKERRVNMLQVVRRLCRYLNESFKDHIDGKWVIYDQFKERWFLHVSDNRDSNNCVYSSTYRH